MRFVLAIHCTCDTPRRLSSAPFPLPPPLYSLLPTLFPTPPSRLLFVAGCQLCCLSICCRLRLPLPPLLCTTLSMYFDNPPYPPLLMQICSCPHFPWLLCCFTAKNYVLFVRGKKEKRGRGPGLFCVGQFGTVRFGCLLSIIWLIFHIRQNLFAVLAIYMGDTPCTINHRLANLVYDVERWRKEK